MTYDITVFILKFYPGDVRPESGEILYEPGNATRKYGSVILPSGEREWKRRNMMVEDADEASNYHGKDDLLWKWVLEDVFDDFLDFFFPDARHYFDLESGFEWLDKELEQLFPPDNKQYAPRQVDKLVKVFNRQGKEECILIHIEIQGYKQDNFPYRMFQYFSRILDKHQKPVTAFAILTEDNKSFHPDRFEMACRGSRLLYIYNTYKILEQDETALERSENPFALIVLIAKTALKGKKLTDARLYELKIDIMKLLLRKNFPKKKIESVLMFLQNYISFKDKSLDEQFEKQKDLLIKGRTEPMGRTEPIGIKKGMILMAMEEGREEGMKVGMEKGIMKGKQQLARNLIVQLGLDDSQVARLTEMTESEVEKIRAALHLHNNHATSKR
ncbi:putative transposase/invertase (TIGR01784 family) [Anseongella ginsenosidimutans]|uniref:Putative transposase/invertase (TIGR01784 family) n=1 Tax=Anseongella ginsenosidimutans TaxID=496056 RepID=A0A4R3KQ97_9SPHI|nr:hypothetical protein [Anseongella ginsenosidimutans]QEC52085.1 hypothetical protein FRZ59_06905 [Anseongella ginsenosidimutans]TCS85605.1 putative transposase/invertase (TIGR01784 family) [Anseongella ginsenosidimutans]